LYKRERLIEAGVGDYSMNNGRVSGNISKRNIKIIIEYDGSRYSGWQRLGKTSVDAVGKSIKKASIQSVIEDSISKLLEEDIKLIGSGRTDAGVHALGQVANFYSCTNLPLREMLIGINRLLPEDIAVVDIKEVDLNFHSRYSAKAKTYEYRIYMGETQSVFLRKYTYHEPNRLNIEHMKKAASYLVGTHDFKGFSTDRRDGKSTIRTIEDIYFHVNGNGNVLSIGITGNGFLYNMVRIIIGTLIEIGEGNRGTDDMLEILTSKKRQKAGITVSGHGLFLYQVYYE